MNTLLGSRFAPEYRLSVFVPESLSRFAQEYDTDHPANVLVFGHWPYGIHDFLKAYDYKCFYFTMLREPLARLESNVNFDLICTAKIDDLYAYVKEKANFITKLLGGGLTQAKYRLEHVYDQFGLTECFDDSLALLNDTYQLNITSYKKVNVTGKRTRLPLFDSDEFNQYIRQLNQDDIEFYEWAKELFQRRVTCFQKHTIHVSFTVESELSSTSSTFDGAFELKGAPGYREALKENFADKPWDRARLLATDYLLAGEIDSAMTWFCAVHRDYNVRMTSLNDRYLARYLPLALKIWLPILEKTQVFDYSSHFSNVLRGVRDAALTYLRLVEKPRDARIVSLNSLAAHLFALMFDFGQGAGELKTLKCNINNLVGDLLIERWENLGQNKEAKVMLYCPDLGRAAVLESFLGGRENAPHIVCVAGADLSAELFGMAVCNLPEQDELEEMGVERIVILSDLNPHFEFRHLLLKYQDRFDIIDLFAEIPYPGPYCYKEGPNLESTPMFARFVEQRLLKISYQTSGKRWGLYGDCEYAHRLVPYFPSGIDVSVISNDNSSGGDGLLKFDVIMHCSDDRQSTPVDPCVRLGQSVQIVDLYEGLPENLHIEAFRRDYSTLVREWVKDRMELVRLMHPRSKILIFGAGKHTTWLDGLIPHRDGVGADIVVLDDHPHASATFGGQKVITPEDFFEEEDSETEFVVVLSTDTFQDTFRRRCLEIFGERVELVDLYEGLPAG